MKLPDIKNNCAFVAIFEESQERIVGIVLDLILCLTVGMTGVTALDLFPSLLNLCV